MKKNKMNVRELFLTNISNMLTVSRIILAFIVIYLIFTNSSLVTIVTVFIIGALTDWFDGQLARKFKWKSEFGRQADMIADRFLWMGTAIAFIISYGIIREINWLHGVQLFLMMMREIISLPFALLAFFSGNPLPKARKIAKLTTFLQGFALPALILSVSYPAWIYLSFPISVICGVTGFISALYYIHDTKTDFRGREK